jgi:glutathione S-transferase
MAPVLGYWKIRGLAEPIRLLLHYVGEDFEDKMYDVGPAPDYNKDSWLNEKYKLGFDFPNLPYYTDGDVKITQSSAIIMHIARKHNLCGETEVEKARVDMILAETIDLNSGFVRISYNPEFEKLKVPYLAALPDKLKQFEAVLGDNPWFIGKKVTVADFPLYELLTKLVILQPKCLENVPKLKAFIDRFEDLPEIKKYMESETYKKLPMNNKMATFGNTA